MGTITTSDGTQLFYKDWGSGQPVVFSHGWPLNGPARLPQGGLSPTSSQHGLVAPDRWSDWRGLAWPGV